MQDTIAVDPSNNGQYKQYSDTRLRTDGTPAFSDEHKTHQFESFKGAGEAGDDHYEEHGKLLRQWLDSNEAKDGTQVLGRAGSSITWQEFLARIPEDRRNSYKCNCCEAWFRRNATTVVVDEEGNSRSLFWNIPNVPEVLKEAYKFAADTVEEALVMGFFTVTEETVGKFKQGEVADAEGNTQGFAHYHLADAPLIKDPGFRADVRLNEMLRDLPNADRVQTRGADLRKAILEVENKSDIVQGHMRMLDAYLKISSVTGRARGGLANRDKSWNAAFFQLASVHALNGFRTSAIGTSLLKYLEGVELNTVVEDYFKFLDPVKYKRKTAEAANGRLTQAEKFFVTAGYDKSLNLRNADRASYVDAASKAERLLWAAGDHHVPVKKEVDTGDGLFTHLRKDVRDEQEAAKVTKPVFKSESISLRAFKKTWLPKALRVKIQNPAAATIGADRMEMSLQNVTHARQKLAVLLSSVIESPTGEGTRPVWKDDQNHRLAQGAEWPYLSYNLDARVVPYLKALGTYWRGLNQAEFEVTEVVLNRFGTVDGQEHLEDRDVIASLVAVVPSIKPLMTTKDIQLATAIRASYFPHRLVNELQPYRDVMEQYISDRGYDAIEEDQEAFTGLVITADPNITIVVETADGFQPLVIATVE